MQATTVLGFNKTGPDQEQTMDPSFQPIIGKILQMADNPIGTIIPRRCSHLGVEAVEDLLAKAYQRLEVLACADAKAGKLDMSQARCLAIRAATQVANDALQQDDGLADDKEPLLRFIAGFSFQARKVLQAYLVNKERRPPLTLEELARQLEMPWDEFLRILMSALRKCKTYGGGFIKGEG
jgi:hypothetical protein